MAKLYAKLLPLSGKYYGSEIELHVEGRGTASIEVWINGVSDYKPSKRELEAWNEEEFGEYEICDDHFESQTAFDVCELIVNALNEVEVS